MNPWRRRAALFALGLVLLSVSWMLGTAPFGGSDEHDHFARAAAVVRGDLLPVEGPHGSGWLRVPPDVARDVSDACSAVRYRPLEVCQVLRSGDDTLVWTGAAAYHPAYYAWIGWPTLLLDSEGALWAARVLSAVPALVLLTIAFCVTTSVLGATWVGLSFLLALTPMLLHSLATIQPSAVEICAAAALASVCLAALAGRSSHGLWLLAVVSGSALALARALGPLFVVLIPLLVARADAGAYARIWLKSRGAWAAALIIGVATATSVAWTVAARPTELGASAGQGLGWAKAALGTVGMLPHWLVGSFGRLPRSGADLPTVAVAVWLSVCLALLAASAMRGDRGLRIAALWTTVMWLVVPAVLVALTAVSSSLVGWQGRYSFPLLLVALMLAGASLTEKHVSVRSAMAAASLVAVSVALASRQAWGYFGMGLDAANHPTRPYDAVLPIWALVALLLAGFAFVALAALPCQDPPGTAEDPTDSEAAMERAPTQRAFRSRLI